MSSKKFWANIDRINVGIVAFSSLIYCFIVFPHKLLFPGSYQWVFGTGPNIRDDAGHAIASMFYSSEPWHWPLGAMNSLGGEVAGSILYFATSPLFAIAFKLFHNVGLVGSQYQFIGIQIVSGIVITNSSLYILCRRLKSSTHSALIVSLTAIFLVEPMIRWTNESLTSQYIIIFALLFSLEPSLSRKRNLNWILLIFLAVGINQYFAPIVILFALIECAYLCSHNSGSIWLKTRNLWASCGAFILSTYIYGGFVLSTLKLNTGIGNLGQFSSNVFSFFDSRGMGFLPDLSSQPSWESYNYLGISFLCLILIALVMKISKRKKGTKKFPSISLLKLKRIQAIPLTCFGAAVCFLLSLGPTLQIGPNLAIHIPLPDTILELLSTFRALARFSWPAMYLLIGAAALSLDQIQQKIGRSRLVVIPLCGIAVFATQAIESLPLIKTMHDIALADTEIKPNSSSATQKNYNASKSIEVIPPFDGDAEGIPWRLTSSYALNAHLPITTWGFFARYDFRKAGEIQSTEVSRFLKCSWGINQLYLIKKDILSSSSCLSNYKVLEKYSSNWILIKTN